MSPAEKTAESTVSVLMQTAGTFWHEAERLRMAHIWGRENNWQPVEDEGTLQEAALRVEKFRLDLLRFARQRLKS
jgi:hypothetical protein